LLKKYRKLWVFGDSYSTPNIEVSPIDSFWGKMATEIGADTIVNVSRPCNSFDSISHLIVGMQEEYNWEEDFLLFCLGPLERVTIFDDYQDTEYLGWNIDTKTWNSNQIDIPCHRGLVSEQLYGTDKFLIIHSDRAWLETQTLRTIFLITSWLDSVKANYLVLNLSKPLDIENHWGPSEFLLNYAKNHPRCNIFNDTYQSVNIDINKPGDFEKYGWNGHHSEPGNTLYFEKIVYPLLQSLTAIEEKTNC